MTKKRSEWTASGHPGLPGTVRWEKATEEGLWGPLSECWHPKGAHSALGVGSGITDHDGTVSPLLHSPWIRLMLTPLLAICLSEIPKPRLVFLLLWTCTSGFYLCSSNITSFSVSQISRFQFAFCYFLSLGTSPRHGPARSFSLRPWHFPIAPDFF